MSRRVALSALGATVALACSSEGDGGGDGTGSGGFGGGSAGLGGGGNASGGGGSGAGSGGVSGGANGTAGGAGTGGAGTGGAGAGGAGAAGEAGAGGIAEAGGAAGAGGSAGGGGSAVGGGGAAGAGGASGAAGSGGTLITPTCELFSGWAAGGTKCMGSAASYPDPFMASGSLCPTVPELTIGPCHTTSAKRIDISNGLMGIPIRMALRVVDSSCKPVAGAIVEVWHTNYKGGYSGNLGTVCIKSTPDKSQDFCRGYQLTDADGVCYFDSCFPGWYSGRALHVHVRILRTSYNASDNAPAASITQLLWRDDFVDSIFKDVPLYAAFGRPDTHLANDGTTGTGNKSIFLFETKKMSEGALLCSKTLVVRA